MEYKLIPVDKNGKKKDISVQMLDSPRSLVIISSPKRGKTDSMISREGEESRILVMDYEEGSAYREASNIVSLKEDLSSMKFHQITKMGTFSVPKRTFDTVMELSVANNMKEFNELHEKFVRSMDLKEKESIKKDIKALIKKMPFPIISIDTVTSFQEQVFAAALNDYNLGTSRPKTDISMADSYNGVRYKRAAFKSIKKFIETYAAPFIIWSGHLAMKKITLAKDESEITVPDMALEGQLPVIFTTDASGVARFHRDDDGCFLDFLGHENGDQDCRVPRLGGLKVKISDLHVRKDNKFILGKTYWEEIYPDVFK